MEMFKKLIDTEDGQGMTEYVLIIVTIALLVIGSSSTIADAISSFFTETGKTLTRIVNELP